MRQVDEIMEEIKKDTDKRNEETKQAIETNAQRAALVARNALPPIYSGNYGSSYAGENVGQLATAIFWQFETVDGRNP